MATPDDERTAQQSPTFAATRRLPSSRTMVAHAPQFIARESYSQMKASSTSLKVVMMMSFRVHMIFCEVLRWCIRGISYYP